MALTPAQIEEARSRAAAAGRRYPNLVDNMYVAKKARRTSGAAASPGDDAE